MTGSEITELLKIITTMIMLLRSQGVTKETIEKKLDEEWAKADSLHEEINK